VTNKNVLKLVVQVAFTAAILFFSLFGAYFSARSSYIQYLLESISNVVRAPRWQWIVVLCIACNVVLALRASFLMRRGKFWPVESRELWLAIFLLISLGMYAANYPVAVRSAQMLVLLFGILLGRLLAIWVHTASHGRFLFFIMIFLLMLMSFMASLWHGVDKDFEYLGRSRWTGPWDDPNLYGMLMGIGGILSAGLVILIISGRFSPTQAKFYFWPGLSFCVVAFLSTINGLFHSYSRGAWLGTFVGFLYLALKMKDQFQRADFPGEAVTERPELTIKKFSVWWRLWFNKNRRLSAVILISVSVLLFWHFYRIEWNPMRRVLSVANTTDFSWRNRIDAWAGALQMISDRPFLGTRWDNANDIYYGFYQNHKTDQSLVMELNDYLLIGSQLGLVALLCLVFYFWQSLRKINKMLDKMFTVKGAPSVGATFTTINIECLQIISSAGAIALLTEFCFDGGFFDVPTAMVFWILLELGSAHGCEDKEKWILQNNEGRFLNLDFWRKFGVCVFFALFIGGVLFGFRSQNPFIRKWFTLSTANFGPVQCVAVLPKPVQARPVVIYAHGSDGNLNKDGYSLRQMAELGLNVVSLNYNEISYASFAAQLKSVLIYISQQSWADTNAMAWVGFSLGAERTMDFAVQNSGLQPRLLILLSSAGMKSTLQIADPEVGLSINSQQLLTSFHCRTLFIHGSEDVVFPVEDTERLATFLKCNHISTESENIVGLPHSLEPDQDIIFRHIGEYCLTYLAGQKAWQNYHSIAEWEAQAPALWLFFIPAACWAIGCFGLVLARRKKSRASKEIKFKWQEITLRWVAAVLAIWALFMTIIHLFAPCFPVNNQTLAIAQKYLLQPKDQPAFKFLARQPIWHNEKLETLLTHVELANYNRELINWRLEDNIYRDYVLSPSITDNFSEQLNWRRSLWEEFYPRIRHVNSPEDAATIVVRHLRERLTVTEFLTPSYNVADIWLRQITDQRGFEIIYVAALRSVGVPAQPDQSGRAVLYDGTRWRPAPRPGIENSFDIEE